ncbi:MAG: hypothetical protein RMH75_07195 [Archaeoglobaceae archaeon]|nr:hypothetical protein [Archaeoglobaceae archaeon]
MISIARVESLGIFDLLIRQLDDKRDVVASSKISVMVNSKDRFLDVAKKLVHNSELSEEIKNDLINWINSANAEDGLIFYVLDEKGEKSLLNLNDRVLDVVQRGNNEIYLDVQRFVGNEIFVVLKSSSLLPIFSYKQLEREVGGYLGVSIIRLRDQEFYLVKRFHESTKKSSSASAIISSNAPHIWHLHPRNFGAFFSHTDEEDVIRAAAIQSLTLHGEPPLSIVLSFRDGVNKEKRVFFSSGLAAVNVGDLLEIRCFLAVPDESCFDVKETNAEIVKNYDELDGFMVKLDSNRFGLISKKFFDSIFSLGSKMPNSVLCLLNCLSGIYSPGNELTSTDFMRVLCLLNVLKRFGVERKECLVFKTDSEKIFSVKISKEVSFVVKEVCSCILDDKFLDLIFRGDGFV